MSWAVAAFREIEGDRRLGLNVAQEPTVGSGPLGGADRGDLHGEVQGVFHARVRSAQVASWWFTDDQDVDVVGLRAGVAEESRRPRSEDQRLIDLGDFGELVANDEHGTERPREDLYQGLVVRARDVSRDQAGAPHPAVLEQARTDEPVHLAQGVRRADPRPPREFSDGQLAGGVQQEGREDACLRVRTKHGQERRSR